MELKIKKDDLLRGLSRIQTIVEKRNTMPVLSNALLEAQKSRLVITATDLEVGIRGAEEADVKTRGTATVSAKKLYEIVRELPDEAVALQSKDNAGLDITCGRARFNLVGIPAEEFPTPAKEEKITFGLIDTAKLKEMVDKTIFAVSSDETRYNLNGVLCQLRAEKTKAKLRMIATDGHRLCMIERDVPLFESPRLEKGVILPRKGLLEMRKIVDDKGGGEVEIGFGNTNAILRVGSTVLTMRLIEGEFPDYRQVIPKGSDVQLTLNRESFAATLKRVSVVSSEKSRGVRFRLAAGVLELSSSNPDLGQAAEEMEVDYKGKELAIGFNARYFLDILSVLDSKELLLGMKDELSQAIVKPTNDNDYVTVVMPMRL